MKLGGISNRHSIGVAGTRIRWDLARIVFCVCVVVFLGWVGVAGATDGQRYQVVKEIALGSATKWDYAAVDAVHARLFLSRGTYVQVLNSHSGEVVGEIKNTAGVHGFAFAPDLNRGFVSNGRTNTVTVFDLETLATLQQVPVTGINPDAIVYDAPSQRIFTFNGRSHDITVIDARRLVVVATLKAAGKPEFAVSDGVGHIYVNIENQAGEMQVIDTASDAIINTWPLANCEEPSGLSIDRQHARLFSTCKNGVMAITNAHTGGQVAQVGIGQGPDASIFDEKRQNALSSNGRSGTLTVVHEDDASHFRVITDLATAKGARTMALDKASDRIYLPTVANNQFTLIVVQSR